MKTQTAGNFLSLDPSYRAHVAALEQTLNTDKALSQAVGGEFVAMGTLEFLLLRKLGLRSGHTVVDIGCGSGRLAYQLAPFEDISYFGSDVVPRLLEYAQALCKRPDWKFQQIEGAVIPCPDNSADFTCFFSVFTHLVHEDTFRYITEAHRVLVPGGLLVMSFLEFQIPSHWRQFQASVYNLRPDSHLNQFLSRDAIEAWADHTGLEVVSIYDGDSNYIPLDKDIECEDGRKFSGAASLGQSLAVLRKPLENALDGEKGGKFVPEHLYVDAPMEGAVVSLQNLRIEGWIWCGAAQSKIEAIQFYLDGRFIGETLTLIPRVDVSSFLGVPANTETGFRLIVGDSEVKGGQVMELQLSIRLRNGRVYFPRFKRKVSFSAPSRMPS